MVISSKCEFDDFQVRRQQDIKLKLGLTDLRSVYCKICVFCDM